MTETRTSAHHVTTPDEGVRLLREVCANGDRAAWTSAALALVSGEQGAPEHRRAAQSLLDVLGLRSDALSGPEIDRVGVSAQAAAPLLQTSALLRSGGNLWADQPDEAILAQGRASAQGAAAFAQLGLPVLTGLVEAFSTPGVRMLDVGTGVAALAASYAALFPELTVVGIDVMPRVLAMAEQLLRDSDVADRVVLREQSVADLTDDSAYALAWLPAPFVPEPAVRAGTPRLTRALAPGGWLLVGHGKFDEDPLDNALTRFKTVCYGGTALDDGQAQALLLETGLVEVMTVPTPPGSPAITVGRRPQVGR
jgi:hypothetical protein